MSDVLAISSWLVFPKDLQGNVWTLGVFYKQDALTGDSVGAMNETALKAKNDVKRQ